MGFAQYLQQHQGMIEGLTGILLVLAVAHLYILVPVICRRGPQDPLEGTRYAKNARP